MLGRTQVELLHKIRERGFSNLEATQLSKYANGHDVTPQARAVMKVAFEILNEWEHRSAQTLIKGDDKYGY